MRYKKKNSYDVKEFYIRNKKESPFLFMQIAILFADFKRKDPYVG